MNYLDFEEIIKHPSVEETYHKYKAFWNAHPEHPFLTYFGLNFDKQGIISVKFYLHLYHTITTAETQAFLPNSEDFFQYYHLRDRTESCTQEHTGIAFELKFKGSLDPTQGFHFRLQKGDDAAALIPKPKKLPFKIDTSKIRLGINYEYSKTETLIKHYYSFTEKKLLQYFSQKLQNSFIAKVDMIEYAESEQFSKINCQRSDYTSENLNRPSFLSKTQKAYIDSLSKKYNIINILDGYYLDKDIVSAYFVASDKLQNNASMKNYKCDTLGLLLSSK